MSKAKAASKVAKTTKGVAKQVVQIKQTLDPLEARRRVMMRWDRPGAREEHSAKIKAHLVAKQKEAEAQALAAEIRKMERKLRALKKTHLELAA